jgi:hypothetical protein
LLHPATTTKATSTTAHTSRIRTLMTFPRKFR